MDLELVIKHLVLQGIFFLLFCVMSLLLLKSLESALLHSNDTPRYDNITCTVLLLQFGIQLTL